MKKRIFNRFLVVCVGAILVFGFAPGVCSAEKIKIAIGQIPHVTGAYAQSQQGLIEGMKDCIQYLNAKNYVPGVELIQVWADGGTDTTKAFAAFKKLLASKPKPVAIMQLGTPFSLSLKKWHMKKKVPDVAGGCDDKFGHLPSWTFSPLCPYANEAGAWVDYFLEKIWKDKTRKPRFAFVTWDNSAGRAIATENSKNYIRSKGVEIVGEEYIPMVPTDTTPQLLRIKEKGVDFTFSGIYPASFGVVLKDMEKLGMIGKVTMGCPYWVSPELMVQHAGDLANGMYFTSMGYAANLKDALKRGHAPAKVFNEKYAGTKRSYMVYTCSWSWAYIAAEAVRIAAAEIGANKVDGTAIYNALQKIKGFDAEGLIVPVTFGPERRFGQEDTVLMTTLKNGNVEALGLYPAPNLVTKK